MVKVQYFMFKYKLHHLNEADVLQSHKIECVILWKQKKKEIAREWENECSLLEMDEVFFSIKSILMAHLLCPNQDRSHAHTCHEKRQTLCYVWLHWMGSRLEMMYLFEALSTIFCLLIGVAIVIAHTKNLLFNIVTYCSHVVLCDHFKRRFAFWWWIHARNEIVI